MRSGCLSGAQELQRPAGGARRKAAALFLLLLCGVICLQTGCRAEQRWPLWQHYREHFLDSSGRIVDHTAGDRTTSEGQGYGMFFALVANDRASFDRMLKWTEDNLAQGDLTAHLPVWSWGNTGNGQWKPLDANSASDADLWIAYDCLEAGRLWHDDHLSQLGTALAERIAQTEVATVPGAGTVLLPGVQGFQPSPGTAILNPSYMPPQIVARVRQQLPGSPWAAVQQDLSVVLGKSAASGFAMDWLLASVTGVHPSPSPEALARGESGAPAVGGYESIRVYLWLGMADPLTPGVKQGLAAVKGMANYLATAPAPPERVTSTGEVASADSPVGFSASVYPFLVATGETQEAAAQLVRVDAALDGHTGLYGIPAAYYDQNLILFATGWKEQRFRFDRNGQLRLKWN